MDNRQFFYNKLTGELGLSPNAALGVLYSLGGESHYNLDTTAVGAGGDFGVAQWTGPRKAGLNALASSLGTSNTDPNTQWQFMKSELTGPYAHVLSGLRNASTPAEATKLWTTDFEAPAVNNWQQRFAGGSQVGSVGSDGTFVPGKEGATPNPTPSGTTLTSTPPNLGTGTTPPATTEPPSPASQFAQGDIGGGLKSMFKQGDLKTLGQSLRPPQQQLANMQAPNLQPHSASPQAAQLLASIAQPQAAGIPTQHPLGALGMPGMPGIGMMGMYPYGMMG